MRFNQELLLNQAGSKAIIKKSKTGREKAYHIAVYLFKIFITMVFCVAFVTVYSKTFGNSNSIVGVVILLCIMGFRFVNTGMKLTHGISAMIMIFIILAIGPRLANEMNIAGQFVINLISILLICILGCHNVLCFNHQTLVLGYLLLFGYDVTGDDYKKRILALFAGAVMTIIVYYRNHRKKEYKRRISDVFKEISLTSTRTRWQITLSVGVAFVIFMVEFMGCPRSMWAGIAAMSIIQPFGNDMKSKMKNRVIGNILGAAVFCALCFVIPESYNFLFGIIGGIGVGFSATYGMQSIFNSLGAMAVATEFLGTKGAMFYRVTNNILGVLIAVAIVGILSGIYLKIEDRYNESVKSSE